MFHHPILFYSLPCPNILSYFTPQHVPQSYPSFLITLSYHPILVFSSPYQTILSFFTPHPSPPSYPTVLLTLSHHLIILYSSHCQAILSYCTPHHVQKSYSITQSYPILQSYPFKHSFPIQQCDYSILSQKLPCQQSYLNLDLTLTHHPILLYSSPCHTILSYCTPHPVPTSYPIILLTMSRNPTLSHSPILSYNPTLLNTSFPSNNVTIQSIPKNCHVNSPTMSHNPTQS